MWLNLGAWIRPNRVLLANAASLVATAVVTSGLGAIFWILAAHLFPVASVGLGSAAISAMTLLSQLGIVGFGTLLIGELPRRAGDRVSLIATTATVVGPVTAVLGLIFSVIAPRYFTNLAPLGSSIGNTLLFTAGVSVAGVALLLDNAVVGLLRSDLQFARNLVLSISKLVLLWVTAMLLSNRTGMGIYATLVIGNAISLVYLMLIAIRCGPPPNSYYPHFSILNGLKWSALWHHALNLTLSTPGLALPIIVTVLMSASMNAYFGVSWMLASFAFLMPTTLTTVLYAVGAAKPQRLAQQMRLTLGLSAGTGVLATALLAGGSVQLLGLFGHMYVEHARSSLIILSIAVFPLTVKAHYVAICRIRGQIARTAQLLAVSCLFEISTAAVGASIAGLSWLGLGWLIAVCVEAILMASTVSGAAHLGWRPRRDGWQAIRQR